MNTGEWHTSDVYAERFAKGERPPGDTFMVNLFERAMVDVDGGVPLQDALAYLKRIGNRALGGSIAVDIQMPDSE